MDNGKNRRLKQIDSKTFGGKIATLEKLYEGTSIANIKMIHFLY